MDGIYSDCPIVDVSEKSVVLKVSIFNFVNQLNEKTGEIQLWYQLVQFFLDEKLRRTHLKKILTLFIILSFCITTLVIEVNAQNSWTSAELIYSSSEVESPMGVSDRYGNLHLFWWGLRKGVEPDTEKTSIIYSKWDGESWTSPTDILISLNNERSYMPAAVIDKDEQVHIIWNGNQLYYSSASSDSADSPQSWSKPLGISGGRNMATQASIAIGRENELHVMFSEAGKDVYHVVSTDNGASWNEPNIVTSVQDGYCTLMPHIAIDSNNVIHIVWSQAPLPEAYPPSGIYYSRSEDGGTTWTDARELAGEGYGEANIVLDSNMNVHTVWNGRATVAGRYHRISEDGGATWSNVDVIVDPLKSAAGLTGEPGLVADSRGRIYFIGGGSYFSVWEKGEWSEPILLASISIYNPIYIEFPQLVITKGNRLNAIIMDGRKNLWHTWTTIDAPEEMAANVINEFVEPTVSYSTLPVIITPTLESNRFLDDTESYKHQNHAWIIGLGTIIPLFMIAILLFRKNIRDTSR